MGGCRFHLQGRKEVVEGFCFMCGDRVGGRRKAHWSCVLILFFESIEQIIYFSICSMYFYPVRGCKTGLGVHLLLLHTSQENIRGWQTDSSVTDTVNCNELPLQAAKNVITFRSGPFLLVLPLRSSAASSVSLSPSS